MFSPTFEGMYVNLRMTPPLLNLLLTAFVLSACTSSGPGSKATVPTRIGKSVVITSERSDISETSVESVVEATTVGAGVDGPKTAQVGVLTVCSDPAQALANIDVSLITAIATDQGLKTKVVNKPQADLFATLDAGGCDVIASSVYISDETKQTYYMTDSYLDIAASILVTSDHLDRNQLTALAGKKVGVPAQSAGRSFARRAALTYGFTMVEVATDDSGTDAAAAALISGDVDAVIQESAANDLAAGANNGKLVVSKILDGSYGFVVATSNPDLRDAINTSLAELRDTGKYDDIVGASID
jgi:ABC-type amino acid transport substrate-binding protein